MPHADFAIVNFGEHLGDRAGDIQGFNLPFKGSETSTHEFSTGTGLLVNEPSFVTIQTYDVGNPEHRIIVNGEPISVAGPNIGAAGRADQWSTYTAVIPRGRLVPGSGNKISVRKASGGDNFIVGQAIIMWRER